MSSLYLHSPSLPPAIPSPALSSLLQFPTSSSSVPFPDKRRNSNKVPAFICRHDGSNGWRSSVQDTQYKLCRSPARIGQNITSSVYALNNWSILDHRRHDFCARAVSKKVSSQSEAEKFPNDANTGAKKSTRKSKRTPRTRMKKLTPEGSGSNETEEEAVILGAELRKADKVDERSQEKGISSSNETVKIRKTTRKKKGSMQVESASDNEDEHVNDRINLGESNLLKTEDEEEELLLIEDDTEDISFTYDWPPLVCCYGAAQHAFIPSGRPANRLINHDIHETMEDSFWHPTKFVRAPGGSSSSVALALASLGGRVALMGKLGDDEYGQCMLYHLNSNSVQTRSVKIDNSKPTAVSRMTISRKGGLKMIPHKSCAEDSLLSSELNIDVLKEAKIFYFNSSSLLDSSMRRTTMHAVKIAKKFGGMIFFDLNLPLPLWHSKDDTMMFIQQAWNYADIIELTKQELEFICGIKSTEMFDTKNNDSSKFLHHKPEVIMPLWHENLKTVFVTNGTSKVHYYTQKDNGWVRGMEDARITPFTSDMSVSGDAMVAGLMRMLAVELDLVTDKGYLENIIKYAINCGVADQWIASVVFGFPSKEGMIGARHITEREYRTVVSDEISPIRG